MIKSVMMMMMNVIVIVIMCIMIMRGYGRFAMRINTSWDGFVRAKEERYRR